MNAVMTEASAVCVRSRSPWDSAERCGSTDARTRQDVTHVPGFTSTRAVGWHFSSCRRGSFVLRHLISSMQAVWVFFGSDVLKARFQVFSHHFITVCF